MPVWRELVADTLTPIGAFRAMVGDGPGFLLESVEHGERWSRFSFVGRCPAATMVARRRSGGGDRGFAPGVGAARERRSRLYRVSARAVPVALDRGPAAASRRSGRLSRLRRRPGDRKAARAPHDDLGHPDAVISVIGELAAFDHWRQRVTLVDNVLLERRPARTDPRSCGRSTPTRSGAWRRSGTTSNGQGTTGSRRRPWRGARLTAGHGPARHERGALLPGGGGRPGVHPLPAMLSRSCCRSASTSTWAVDPFEVYRVLRQVNPSPYMFFLRQGGVSVVGASPEPMVQLLDGRVVSRPIAGHAPARRERRGGPQTRSGAGREPERACRARDARRSRPQRRRQDRALRFRTGRRADDRRALQPRHAPDLGGLGRAGGRSGTGGRVAGDTARGHRLGGAEGAGDGDHRRARADQARARMPASSGYIDFSGNLDTAIAIRTLVATPTGRPPCRPEPGSSPTATRGRGRGVRGQGRSRAGGRGRGSPAVRRKETALSFTLDLRETYAAIREVREPRSRLNAMSSS